MIRARIERAFRAYGQAVVRHPWLAILACVALTLTLCWKIPDIRVDNSPLNLLHQDDPDRILYHAFKDEFGREDRISVIVQSDDVFDLAFLESLRGLHHDIEAEVPHIEEVLSLINVRDTRGEDDELVVEGLMERWPETEAELRAILARALDNPLYPGAIFSHDRRYALISVLPVTYSSLGADDAAFDGFEDDGASGSDPNYLTDDEQLELIAALEEVLARYEAEGLVSQTVGKIVVNNRFEDITESDSVLFSLLSALVTISLLFVFFRRLSAVILAPIVVWTATAATLGSMAWLDIPFSVTLSLLSALLTVVAIGDSVHILTITYQGLDAGLPRKEAVAGALEHSGLAVVLTSITTACGLLSFTAAEIAPVVHLGLLSAIGVMLAMIYSLVMLPGILVLVPLRRRTAADDTPRPNRTSRLLAACGELATQRPRSVVLVAIVVVLVGLPGIFSLRFSHDTLSWFPADDPSRIATTLLDENLGGASRLEVVIDLGQPNALKDPANLRRIDLAAKRSQALEVDGRPMGTAISIVQVVRETHRALNDNRTEFYTLPDDPALVAQELLLFEIGSDDLEDLTDATYQKARVTLRTPWADAMHYQDLIADVEAAFRDSLGNDVEFYVTGEAAVQSRVFEGLVESLARSYMIAFAMIAPLMMLVVGSMRRGLIAMIPNVLPIYVILSFMGWTSIPLDASTMLIGGLILGIAVDDTIHFMHGFSRAYADTRDVSKSVHGTLITTGAALLFTSLILFGGFIVFTAGYFSNVAAFGGLTALAAIAAFVADIFLLPALLTLGLSREAS